MLTSFFGWYYLSFRNQKIKQRFEAMFKRFRNYLVGELEVYRNAGIVKVTNLKKAADVIITLMEGLEYHAHFLSENESFEEFASYSRQLVVAMLEGQAETDPRFVQAKKKNLGDDNIKN